MGATQTRLTLTEYLVIKIINDENEKCMIQESEIRIGNRFNHNAEWSSNHSPNVYFVWDASDWYALGESTLSLENVEPIPLTEEWLIKFGFVPNVEYAEECDWIYEINYTCIGSEKESSSITSRVIIGKTEWGIRMGVEVNKEGIVLREIEYLHQLQNLFFALTGNELNLSNDTRH